jgi:S1-C subfamily serine protease
MKILGYLVVALVLKHFYFSATEHQQSYPIDPVNYNINQDASYEGVVRIYKSDAMCSGVVIGQNYILTAAHCATGFGRFMTSEKVSIRDFWGVDTGVKGEFVALSHDHDVALLKGNFSNFKLQRLNTHFSPKIGEHLKACGFPLNGSYVCNDVIFTSNYYLFYFVTGASLEHGQSGGPVYNSFGEVIAVNSAITQTGSLLSPTMVLEQIFDL